MNWHPLELMRIVWMDRSDAAVLDAIEQDVLTPDVVTVAIRKALDRLAPAPRVA